MNKKELLSELIELERTKLNRLIELELAQAGCLPQVGEGGGNFSTGERISRHSEAVYHQSRYLDRLIEIYMMSDLRGVEPR